MRHTAVYGLEFTESGTSGPPAQPETTLMAYEINTKSGIKSFTEDQIRSLHDAGKLPGTAKIRRAADQSVLTVSEVLTAELKPEPDFSGDDIFAPSYTPPVTEQAPAPAESQAALDPLAEHMRGAGARVAEQHASSKMLLEDPWKRGGTVIALMGITIVVSAIAIWSNYQQYLLADGRLVTEAMIIANDSRQFKIQLTEVAIMILSIVFFCRWILIVNRNAIRMADHEEQITIRGGWAVGYHFIPIINLVRPYQSMGQMFAAAKQDTNIVVVWWASWLGSGLISGYARRYGKSVDSVEAVQTWSQLEMAADSAYILAALIAALLVFILTASQANFRSTQLNS